MICNCSLSWVNNLLVLIGLNYLTRFILTLDLSGAKLVKRRQFFEKDIFQRRGSKA